MQTYLLSEDDVRRYSIDLIDRLTKLGDEFPRRWLSLGRSGDKMIKALRGALPPDVVNHIKLTRISYDRQSKRLAARDQQALAPGDKEGVLLVDSAVHSGSSMSGVVDELYKLGFAEIICYSLIVKKSTSFVPNYFGLLIAEHDRALFQLEKLPNNRLQRKSPFATVRAVRAGDVDIIPDHISCGVASIDKITYADLLYGSKTQGSSAFISVIRGVPAGFIQFSIDADRIMRIDAIANDKRFRGQGVGGALMRWAESYARFSRCRAIELWAIKDRIDFYKHCGFETLDKEEWNLGKGETYIKMTRKILYNLKTQELFE